MKKEQSKQLERANSILIGFKNSNCKITMFNLSRGKI